MDFFQLSKTFSWLLDPLNSIFLLLLITMVLLWRGKILAARRTLGFVIAVLLAVIVIPIGSLLLWPLEQRFPQLNPQLEKVDGIIMLGGAQRPLITRAYGQASVNGHAERMTTFLMLARRYPKAKLVFSGGSGDMRNQDVTEAATVKLFLQEQGFDANRVLYEDKSRNTYENGVFSKKIAEPKTGETWLLITSAADLPRAVGVFRRIAWPVVPVPCDYDVLEPRWRLTSSLLDALLSISHGLHEWIGLAVYYLTDKSDSFFPVAE